MLSLIAKLLSSRGFSTCFYKIDDFSSIIWSIIRFTQDTVSNEGYFIEGEEIGDMAV